MRGEVLGQARRRRWSDETKLSVVVSVGSEGASVAQVAQRHEITRQQIYGWRRELKRKGLLSVPTAPCFLPVAMDEAPDTPEVPKAALVGVSARVELRLRHGRRLRFDIGTDSAVLIHLIRAVEAA